MRLNGGRHLTYCMHVHSADSWEEVEQALAGPVYQVKEHAAPREPFGIGLRLSNRASTELLAGDRLTRLQRWMEEANSYAFTLNGFPFGSFAGAPIKDQVFLPDWTQKARFDYTRRLAAVLTALLPEEVPGTISTLPLAFKTLYPRSQWNQVFERCASQIAELVAELFATRENTGRHIVLALEPEPLGLLETTDEVIAFFADWLLERGSRLLANRLGRSPDAAMDLLLSHVGVCYDTCSQAVEFESVLELEKLLLTGIAIPKIQLGCALSWRPTASTAPLRRLGNPPGIHRVFAMTSEGDVVCRGELADLIAHSTAVPDSEWRIHYHVPASLKSFGELETTRRFVEEVLGFAKSQLPGVHLEIESYAWSVQSRPPDPSRVADEIAWVSERLDRWS